MTGHRPGTARVRPDEVEPAVRAPASGPRVAVLVSLNFPDLTEPVADLVRRFTRTTLGSLHEAGARTRLLDSSDASLLPSPEEALSGADGLLLLGGGDADSTLYGVEGPVPGSYGVDRAADEYGIDAVHTADRAGLPVLGICRGSQLINLAFGGDLIPDLEDHRLHRGGPGQPLFLDEKVSVAPGSRLASLAGGTALTVRSGHHQAVRRVGSGLTAVAWAQDGVIEGVEHPDRWITGMQWHPEDPDGDDALRRAVFTGFTAACGGPDGKGSGPRP